ncbi:MAG: symmetrical bis(5'-nucleosyl)-tetraphosphatase [Betaproteobacteria bacterium]|nr:symmetrical bis(5'-nucleosyl)-tetraphosphatase [Betaproteobacteria bacterium]
MSTYAVGDVQGCFASLEMLLTRIPIDWKHDRLWFVGDLANRGPQSLETLRFVKSLGSRAITVLGNHDLHLLCVAEGFARHHEGDTLRPILEASDREVLLDWLRHRPMMHSENGFVMVHAGLLPQWSISQAQSLAHEVEAALQATNYREFLEAMYGNQPRQWSNALTGMDRLRVITNAMTRIRLCTADGVMEFTHKGEPKDLPHGYLPWYDIPGRQSRAGKIIFGHWSALGLHLGSNVLALDTGCLWGGQLTAVRLEDQALFQVPCEKRSHHSGLPRS